MINPLRKPVMLRPGNLVQVQVQVCVVPSGPGRNGAFLAGRYLAAAPRSWGAG